MPLVSASSLVGTGVQCHEVRLAVLRCSCWPPDCPAAAHAQLPFPFGASAGPGGAPPQCTPTTASPSRSRSPDWRSSARPAPSSSGQVCTLIEGGSALVGGELPDSVREQIKAMLGVDVDLRFIKTQCRVGQGNLDRELMTQLGISSRAPALQRHHLATASC